MRRILRMDLLLILGAVVISAVVALAAATEEDSGYPRIAENLEPLRAAFNADPGNVRAILLASPT